ncbi:hypothetical protein PVAP13_2NG074184, partial [Panicum virgatum]
GEGRNAGRFVPGPARLAAEKDTAVAGVERSARGRPEDQAGMKRTVPSPMSPTKPLRRKPSTGGFGWSSRNLRRKPGPETRRRQRLHARAARTRRAGSSGGTRTRISSTISSGSGGGGRAAMMRGRIR